jgi:glycyl-tRNA synthetase beta chain
MPDLLIELFSEEIPARMQSRAAADLQKLVTDGLVEAGLTYGHAAAFATPRRLALAVEGLLSQSPSLREERKGPRVDAPEKAVEGFLRSTGLTRDQLEARDTGKGEVWFAVIDKPGRPAGEIVAEVLEATVRGFPWPKSMRWGGGALRWVRPLHSILCVLSENGESDIVDLEIDNIRAGNTTEGHRFMAPGRFTVSGFEDYAAKLKRANVILSAEERAEHIWHDATQAAFAQGLEVVEDKGLLAEVAGLVEWPVVLMGEIGAEFLELPAEVLRTSMKEHQKFFSVKDKSGRIVRFVTVANRDTADQGATILAGNGRVLSARLSDAKFFWENDLRTIANVGMTGMAEPLRDVTFHNKLGSQAERIDRIAALAREIAPVVGAKPDLAEEAARIAKADLASEMVYEFPELQGIMGRYYAEAAGHDDGVPEACRDHYSPLGPNDAVPTHPVSVAVALADKIDTLTGFWAIDEKPTGSKDPFALRRAEIGIIRLVTENGLRISWFPIIDRKIREHQNLYRSLLIREAQSQLDIAIARLRKAEALPVGYPQREVEVDIASVSAKSFQSQLDQVVAQTSNEDLVETAARIAVGSFFDFREDRLKVYLRDRGIRHDVIDACLAMPNADDLTLLVKRAEALQAFLDTEDGTNLLQGFKRAHNILTQAQEKDGVEYSFGPDPKLAETDEERALFAALDAAEATIAPAMKAEEFGEAMAAMAGLRAPIDAFFDTVQVNADSQILRRNRLNLLHRISATCLSVADLTLIEG